jgi:hypothetical protein
LTHDLAGGVRPDPADALRRCVGDPDGFLERFWARAPLHLPGRTSTSFDDLLSLADVDHLIAAASLRAPAFRLVKDGKPLPPASYLKSGRIGSQPVTDLADPGRIYRQFDAGATIVLQSLHRYWPPLTRFCRDLELTLTHPVQVNAYVTPPGSRGLGLHADGHDVFVLQVHGRKRWEVYQPGPDGDAAPGAKLLDVTLRPGDCLYVPLGFPHAVWTEEAASAHLTVGVLAATWHGLLRGAVLEALDDDEFRRPLPAGFAENPALLATAVADRLAEVQRRLGKLDPVQVATAAARRFWSSRPPLLSGQLGYLLELDAIGDQTLVRRRSGAVCRLERDGGALAVLLGDRRLTMPAWVEPALRAVLAADRFAVGDLAPHLDAPGRLVLVQRLVREGLLEPAGV